jgi:hypothetical protein
MYTVIIKVIFESTRISYSSFSYVTLQVKDHSNVILGVAPDKFCRNKCLSKNKNKNTKFIVKLSSNIFLSFALRKIGI